MNEFDVVVIGAGLTGSMTARALAQRGSSVLVLEARELGHAAGSSHGSSRGYRRGQSNPKLAEMAARSYHLWRELEEESGSNLLRLTGAIDFGTDRRPVELHATFIASGVKAELLSPSEAEERWPQMRFPTEVVYHADAGILDPEAAIRAALDIARFKGAIVRTGTPVQRITREGASVLVHTADNTYRAGHVVAAMGPWLPGFLKENNTGLPAPQLSTLRQSVFHFPTRDGSDDWPVVICKQDRQFYAVPSGADTGTTPTIKVGMHDGGTETSPDAPGGPDPEVLENILGFVRKWAPGLHDEPVRADTCFYTSTPDESFVLDRADAITLASPCSGQGAKFAPLVGNMIADLALGMAEPDPAFRIAAQL